MRPFENITGKGENAGNQHFLLFPQCFLPIPKRIFVLKFHLSSANAFNLDQSKNLSFGKVLRSYSTVSSIPCDVSKYRPITSQPYCWKKRKPNYQCCVLLIQCFHLSIRNIPTYDWAFKHYNLLQMFSIQ